MPQRVIRPAQERTRFTLDDWKKKAATLFGPDSNMAVNRKYHRRRPWSVDEDEFLIEHYAENFNEDLSQALDRSVPAINARAAGLGLRKSHQIRSETGRMSINHPNAIATRFKPGNESWTKGKKLGSQWGAKTQFKPGTLPPNTAPEGDGALRRRCDYWYIRLSLGRWRQLHTHLWEQANRPLQPGEMVKFRDGNRDNCTLENLYLCTRAENMRMNTIHNLPPDLKATIHTLTKFKKVIRQYEKQDHRSTRPTSGRDGTPLESRRERSIRRRKSESPG